MTVVMGKGGEGGKRGLFDIIGWGVQALVYVYFSHTQLDS